MPDFWQFPTVSMGLGPDHGHLPRALHQVPGGPGAEGAATRSGPSWGWRDATSPKRWAPSRWPSREKLDNLIFVINCNLQRLDGPVRGNGKIIQELEAAFRGAGWNVIKVIWGSDWDPLLEQDDDGLLSSAWRKSSTGSTRSTSSRAAPTSGRTSSETTRAARAWWSICPTSSCKRLMRARWSRPRKGLRGLQGGRGAHGPPTVILAKTIKGYGMGEGGEGMNITHQQKKLNEEELLEFRTRFHIPISDEDVNQLPFYRCPPDGPRRDAYLRERRAAGRLQPAPVSRMRLAGRRRRGSELFEEFHDGTGGPRGLHDHGLRAHAGQAAARRRRSAS